MTALGLFVRAVVLKATLGCSAQIERVCTRRLSFLERDELLEATTGADQVPWLRLWTFARSVA